MKHEKRGATYGDSVLAQSYEWGLMLHQYIPQADAGIIDTVEALAVKRKNKAPLGVLDLGMGPGRLTHRLGSLENTSVIGLDNSPKFIEAARRRPRQPNVKYVLNDFLRYRFSKPFDSILMQGVFHHVHGDERKLWLEKMHSMLAPEGTLIIGDEFIPEYASEDERRARAGLFYLHIIGEAIKARAQKGKEDLAREECINFIADVLSGETACGYYDEELLAYIKAEAASLNDRLFVLENFGETHSSRERITGDAAAKKVKEIIERVRARADELKSAGTPKQIDRGDYKVSIPALTEEFAPYFVPDLEAERKFGPVDSIGGMAVLAFRKA